VTRPALHFRVPGTPHGKRPPQHVAALGRTLKAKGTRAYERLVAAVARAARAGRDALTGPVEVAIVAVWPRPASRPAAVERASWAGGGRLYRPAKPDADNVAKAILDGAKVGGLFADDATVVRLTVAKCYAAVGEAAGVEVTVTPVVAWEVAG
jgi:Holliday junction resolvase RusA-like endonuclease